LAGAAAIVLSTTALAQNVADTQVPTDTQSPARSWSEEAIVVTPTKFPIAPGDVGSAVSVIREDELATRQINTLEEAIRIVPGVITASSGQAGSVASVFLRGANSNQTQFLVDGIRISDSNVFSNNFAGGAVAHNLDAIEILRGPQSALYGGEAIGGVISLWSRQGEGDPTGDIELSAGSFDSFRTRLGAQGRIDDTSYSLSTGWETTANDRPHNDFEQFLYTARIDHSLSEATSVGMTVRGALREFESPGSRFENDPDNTDEEEFLLLTAYLDHKLNDVWKTHLLAGWLNQDLSFDFPPVGASRIDNEKIVVDWRNTLEWGSGHTTLFGFGFENNSVENNGFGAIDDTETIVALYLQQVLAVTEAFTITGGGRWEDYDSFGNIFTWRAAAAYHCDATATTLRGSVGSAFRAPSFFELFASSESFIGNPDLDAEESLGWDVGIEQDAGSLGKLTLTWFENDIDDLISSDFSRYPATVTNLEQASTSGLECEWTGHISDQITWRMAYTYLRATNDTTGEKLLRRPEHTLGFNVNWSPSERLTLGMGGYWLQDRSDIDPESYATIEGDNYFIARLYGSFSLCENAAVNLRIENAFDEDYDEVAGFPGRGLGIFGGLKIRL
jgi:vitamin B12 transporter